jgi:hypothetical protein
MIPGASAPELAATDITLFVLADAGHAHNVAPTRAVLWDRIASWIDAIR